ncbi:EAP30 subunit of ELL complex-like protein [Ochromonadaceae sp. CCMP2298]|nr:EAP30 subunit of ELL complex-like protein [Ochromonadaceae sp. CCMP2298]
MRRKIGVSVVKKRQEESQQYTKVGKTLEENKLSFVKEVLSSFKTSLADFASKHKDRINSDPEFRQQFHAMCVGAGVDPLASGKGFWADILGVGDFYFELGVKIIQISVQTRAENGGIISVEEVLRRVRNAGQHGQGQAGQKGQKGSQMTQVSQEDLTRAVEKLAVLGGGFKLIKTGGGGMGGMIISVPVEISTDHEYVLSAASDEEGCVTQQLMAMMHGWTQERFDRIMDTLLQEGIVWIDDHNGERRYYFPSMWKSAA